MRYLLIILSLTTLVLAVILAMEGQWFIAIPDAIFGLGVGYFAWVSLREERHPRPPQLPPPPEPAPRSTPPALPPVMPPVAPPPARTPPRRPRRRR